MQCKHSFDCADNVLLGLVKPNGTVAGDKWGETDTRFLYIVVHALSLLGRLEELDKEPLVKHLSRCMNFDGAFGTSEGAESHGAQGGFFADIS